MFNFFSIYKVLLKHFREGVRTYFTNWRENLRELITARFKEKTIALTLGVLTFVYVRLQDVEQRNFFVPLQIDKIDELIFINELPKTVSLFVSGNRSALNNLDVNKIAARIDLTDVTFPGIVQRSPILESIPEGIQILRINPQTLEIELSNLEKKLLKVEANLIGRTRSGYKIRNIEVSPGRLWVFGPRDILNDLTKIETEPIDIQALDRSKQIDVAFNKNIHPGLKFDRDRRLDVLISIESEYTIQTLGDQIEVSNTLENHLQLTESLMVSNISYEIHMDEVSTFDINRDIVFYFQTNGIDQSGEYTVKILFQNPKKLRNVSYMPDTAVIQLRDNDESLDSE